MLFLHLADLPCTVATRTLAMKYLDSLQVCVLFWLAWLLGCFTKHPACHNSEHNYIVLFTENLVFQIFMLLIARSQFRFFQIFQIVSCVIPQGLITVTSFCKWCHQTRCQSLSTELRPFSTFSTSPLQHRAKWKEVGHARCQSLCTGLRPFSTFSTNPLWHSTPDVNH